MKGITRPFRVLVARRRCAPVAEARLCSTMGLVSVTLTEVRTSLIYVFVSHSFDLRLRPFSSFSRDKVFRQRRMLLDHMITLDVKAFRLRRLTLLIISCAMLTHLRT